MSVYGPKIELPHLELPDANIDPKIVASVIGLIALIILVIYFAPPFIQSLNPPLKISWTNNPLDLKDNPSTPASLDIIVVNNTKEMTDITLSVTTESDEIIIFCPYTTFSKVEPDKERQTTCLLRRNPESTIFSGTYNIKVKSNLGEMTTVLEVKTK
jgi:hypothetical protein